MHAALCDRCKSYHFQSCFPSIYMFREIDLCLLRFSCSSSRYTTKGFPSVLSSVRTDYHNVGSRFVLLCLLRKSSNCLPLSTMCLQSYSISISPSSPYYNSWFRFAAQIPPYVVLPLPRAGFYSFRLRHLLPTLHPCHHHSTFSLAFYCQA